jgi:hypothetical protein
MFHSYEFLFLFLFELKFKEGNLGILITLESMSCPRTQDKSQVFGIQLCDKMCVSLKSPCIV